MTIQRPPFRHLTIKKTASYKNAPVLTNYPGKPRHSVYTHFTGRHTVQGRDCCYSGNNGKELLDLQVFFVGNERQTFEKIRSILTASNQAGVEITWSDGFCPPASPNTTNPMANNLLEIVSFCDAPTEALIYLRSRLRAHQRCPIIALIPEHDYSLDHKLMNLGIDDCLPLADLSAPVLTWCLQHAWHRHLSNQKISYLATHDRLTGIANRYLLLEHAEHLFHRCKRQQQKFALMFIGLDGFRRINDSLGHEIGDMLLREVADRLQTNLRETDLLARYGGDEFVLLLEDIGEEKNISRIARHVQQLFGKPFVIHGQELFVSASIGIASYPQNGKDVDTIIRAANSALAQAKELGSNQLNFFSPELNVRMLRKIELERYLRRAILRQEFIVYYQPQIRLCDGRVAGAEALLRWQHPDLGLVSPAEFIPLLEELALLPKVEHWVLHQVCQDAVRLHKSWGPLRFSVNISGSHFRRANLKESIYLALQQADLEAQFLEIELTEDVMIEHIEHNNHVLNELTELGIGIALDDFGKGYSSLSYLRNFPASVLKIDKTFIDQIEHQGKDKAIVESLINLSHQLGIQVVSEGVEKADQVALLNRFGCDYVQGYYFAKPMPCEAFEKYIRQRQPAPEISVGSLKSVS